MIGITWQLITGTTSSRVPIHQISQSVTRSLNRNIGKPINTLGPTSTVHGRSEGAHDMTGQRRMVRAVVGWDSWEAARDRRATCAYGASQPAVVGGRQAQAQRSALDASPVPYRGCYGSVRPWNSGGRKWKGRWKQNAIWTALESGLYCTRCRSFQMG